MDSHLLAFAKWKDKRNAGQSCLSNGLLILPQRSTFASSAPRDPSNRPSPSRYFLETWQALWGGLVQAAIIAPELPPPSASQSQLAAEAICTLRGLDEVLLSKKDLRGFTARLDDLSTLASVSEGTEGGI